MPRPRALDLFSGAGGVSVGLERAGYEVTAVDIRAIPCHRGGTFIQADALTFPLEGYDLIWASPPCQAHTVLRHLTGKEYPDLIPATRERLVATGGKWVIENVPGAPLGEAGWLSMLCGTMFGLETPDGRAEIRRHRYFESSFPISTPPCRHGRADQLHVAGHDRWINKKVIRVGGGKAMSGGMAEPQGSRKRRAISVTGHTGGVRSTPKRETFSTEDARAAMGIDWMPMKYLSQAIPPAYAECIGRQALGQGVPEGCELNLFHLGRRR